MFFRQVGKSIFICFLCILQCGDSLDNCPLPETANSQEKLRDNFGDLLDIGDFSDTEDIKAHISLVYLPDPEICGPASGDKDSNEEQPTQEPLPPGSDESKEIHPSIPISPDDPGTNTEPESCYSKESKIRKEGHQNLINDIEEKTNINITEKAENIYLSIGEIDALLKKPEVECLARHKYVQKISLQKVREPVTKTRTLRIHEIEAPETVPVSDESFMITLKNTCENNDNCHNEDYIHCYEKFLWVSNKEGNQLYLTPKVSSTLSLGEAVCEALQYFSSKTYQIQGPFQIGNFRIVVHQPDNTTLEKVVKIVE